MYREMELLRRSLSIRTVPDHLLNGKREISCKSVVDVADPRAGLFVKDRLRIGCRIAIHMTL